MTLTLRARPSHLAASTQMHFVKEEKEQPQWEFVTRTRADDLADYFRAPAGLRGGFAVTQRAEVRIAE